MTVTTMTLQQALTEIKHLSGAEVNAAINQGTYAVAVQGTGLNAKIIGGKNLKSVSTADKEMEANFDRAFAKIRRLLRLRESVAKANANTEITIAGKKMTISDALALRSGQISVLQYMGILHQTVANQMSSCQVEVARSLPEIQKQRAAYTLKLTELDPKADIAAVQAQMDADIARIEVKLMVPEKVLKTVEKLKEEVSAFDKELDYALSVANATTSIEVNFD